MDCLTARLSAVYPWLETAMRGSWAWAARWPLDPTLDLDAVLAFRHARAVVRDDTVKYRWRTLHLPTGPRRHARRLSVLLPSGEDGKHEPACSVQ